MTFSSSYASASEGDMGWTWESGSPVVTASVSYGQKGVESATNSPGARWGATTWTDAAGNLWLFGGWILSENDDLVDTNDVWMYNRTSKLWVWKSGSNIPEIAGSYGALGTPSTNNFPGSRHDSSAWLDNSGKVWIFGGNGNDAIGQTGRLNDLWKYDPALGTWAWIGGSNSTNSIGNYGTIGVTVQSNQPGARTSAASWVDGSGIFWLYGGEGFGVSASSGQLGDLWKYDPGTGNWTWMKGTSNLNAVATTGVQGTAALGNMPGGLSAAITWKDATSLWFYGGFGKVEGGYGGYSDWLNDLWRYDIVTGYWTWMKGTNELGAIGIYGTQGVEDAANRPGSRSSGAGWTDSAGNFWLYGGYGYTSDPLDSGYLADTWRYTPGTNRWTWMSGSLELEEKPAYGSLGVADPDNVPGSRNAPLSWSVPGGNGWIYGGEIYNYDGGSRSWSDLWEFNSSSDQWAWVGGPKAQLPTPEYGTKGTVSSLNRPGARTDAATWETPDGDLWMLGGEGFDTSSTIGLLNDLWKFDPDTGNWVWVSGSKIEGDDGYFSPKGVSKSYNMLPGRESAVTWADNSGNLWIFGGYAVRLISGVHSDILRNDLWKYNLTNKQWTWMTGGQYNQDMGVYGDKGVADDANTPGSRNASVSWKDSEGNFWLFGGYGATATSSQPGRLNDLWKYNPGLNQWTWMHGSDDDGVYGTYGELGLADEQNTPGARKDAASWTDSSGNFWLFGGEGFSELDRGDLNDLWVYEPSIKKWTWVAGSSEADQKPVYGSAGIPDALNTPGARYQSVTWVDTDGNLWLFGGKGRTATSTFDWGLDEVWKFDMTLKQWAWMYGTNEHYTPPVYGTRGDFAATNTPGARYDAPVWSGNGSAFWLFSGAGSNVPEADDMWKFSTGVTPASAADWQLFD